jgi:hypothetical protein
MITRGNPWAQETLRGPYPFVDTASLRDTSGILTLSPAWITDAKLWPAVASVSKIYVSSVERTALSLVITVASLDETLATATISNFSKRRVAFRDSLGGQVGFMSFAPGGLKHIHDVPSRKYVFSVDATEFTASALSLRAAYGVSGISLSDGSTLSGDIPLVGGEGVHLSIAANNTVRVDIFGDPYFSRERAENPTALGLALRPVRKVAYQDVSDVGDEVNGVLTPFSGNIVTSIFSESEDFRSRGFRSPGPTNTILERIV